MKSHTLLAQDEDNQTRVYSCHSGHSAFYSHFKFTALYCSDPDV